MFKPYDNWFCLTLFDSKLKKASSRPCLVDKGKIVFGQKLGRIKAFSFYFFDAKIKDAFLGCLFFMAVIKF